MQHEIISFYNIESEEGEEKLRKKIEGEDLAQGGGIPVR